MIQVRTRGHTNTFVNGGRKGDSCDVLSVRREMFGSDVFSIRHKIFDIGRSDLYFSTWRPSFDEIQRIVNGECVELCCIGTQPPVFVAVAPMGNQDDQIKLDEQTKVLGAK